MNENAFPNAARRRAVSAFLIGAGVATLFVLCLLSLMAFEASHAKPSASIGAILALPWKPYILKLGAVMAFAALIGGLRRLPVGGLLRRAGIGLGVLLCLCGIYDNAAAFKKIDRADLYRLQAQRTPFLAERAVKMPDDYRSGDVLLWLRQQTAGSELTASAKTLGLAGLVPHRVMGLSLIKVRAPAHEPALSALPALSSFKRFAVAEAPKPLFIDPVATQKGARLCAVETPKGILILAADAVPDCEAAP